MRTPEDHQKATTIVRAVIAKWNPRRRFACGCDDDPYHAEVANIVRRSRRIRSRIDAEEVITKVFTEAFGVEPFPPGSFEAAGADLFEQLKDAGLIGSPPDR